MRTRITIIATVISTIVCVILLSAGNSIIAESKSRPSAEEVLAAYERSLLVMREKVSYDAEYEIINKGDFLLKRKKMIRKIISYRDTEGNHFAIFTESKGFDSENKLMWHNTLRAIINDKNCMSYSSPIGQQTNALLIDSEFITPKDGLVMNTNLERVLDGISYGAELKSIIEVVRESSSLILREERENVDGYATYVLEADTKYGKHILYIDPKYGFNPRRMIFRKTIGDFYNKTKVGDEPSPLSDGSKPATPWSAKAKTEFVVDSIKIEKVGETFVPVSAKITERINYKNGQFTEQVCLYRRTNIKFNINFDNILKVFISDIPNGTPVYFEDERRLPGVIYKWSEGKVVDSYGHEVNLENMGPQSLVGKALPELAEFNINLNPDLIENRLILICFWDVNQKPSRNCILALNKQSKALSDKDVYAVFVQAEPVDEHTIAVWLKENNIRFSVGISKVGIPELRHSWAVQSLPWLIMTDKNHIVTAEGISIAELHKKIIQSTGGNH